MKTKRIGPGNPGRSRLFAARFALLVIAAFYAAGLTLITLYAFGVTPSYLHR